MQCPCGGETRSSQHAVLSEKFAHFWLPNFTAEVVLPIQVNRNVCIACEREDCVVIDANGVVLRHPPWIGDHPALADKWRGDLFA